MRYFCVFLFWATSRSGFPFFCFNSFPLLTMSPLLLQFLPSSCEKPGSFNLYYNQRLSHGIVSACWRLPAKAFATKNNTTTLWYKHTTTKNNTVLQINQTTRHPHSRTKHPTNNPTTLLTLPIITHTINYVEQYQTIQPTPTTQL